MSEQRICLIVGLGNPGLQYSQTRHNAGFWFLDKITKLHNLSMQNSSKFKGSFGSLKIGDHLVHLLQPNTFMNLSGESVGAFTTFYKIPPESILIIHDDLDLPAGTIRIKFGGSTGGHNGLHSIITSLGKNTFYRLRIGIGRPFDSRSVVDYVLNKPNNAEFNEIHAAITKGVKILPEIISGDFQKAIQFLHTLTQP